MLTAEQLADINAATLTNFIDKGTVWKQNIQNKPMLDAFNRYAGSFAGGKEDVSFAVAAGQGGGGLTGYSGDDKVSFYNPTGTKRAYFPWKEHHIGLTITHSERKTDGVEISEGASDEEKPQPMSGREQFALANLLDEKNDALAEDYAFSLDRLIHGDGSSDAKAIAGIGALVIDNPLAGSTGRIGRVANPWWTNRAATAAYGVAGGQGAITSATANGGALIAFLEKEWRQLSKKKRGGTKVRIFAGSDFIDAYMLEIRANGNYSTVGFNNKGNVDGGMSEPYFKGTKIEWDPTLDDIGMAKRAYFLDTGRTGVRLLYMNGQRMKKHSPDRPYDRYVMYNGLTMTGVMVAKQLNTSGVYDIT